MLTPALLSPDTGEVFAEGLDDCVHGAIEQTVDLNRLNLEDGEVYELAFFFAERHRTASNFRITTNLRLQSVTLPTVTAAFD